ncbi:MAG: hypothetical protein JWP34_4806, partial [Massilia sp.]|nr:hypothetical protein [Massilia sp.]
MWHSRPRLCLSFPPATEHSRGRLCHIAQEHVMGIDKQILSVID